MLSRLQVINIEDIVHLYMCMPMFAYMYMSAHVHIKIWSGSFLWYLSSFFDKMVFEFFCWSDMLVCDINNCLLQKQASSIIIITFGGHWMGKFGLNCSRCYRYLLEKMQATIQKHYFPPSEGTWSIGCKEKYILESSCLTCPLPLR